MDRTAIERIEELTHAASSVAGKALDDGAAALVLPKNCELTDLEKFQAAPRRMRQTFSTERLDDFIAYVEYARTDTTAVYVMPDGSSARAIIDHGTHDSPDWGEHKAKLNLKYTPAFQALADRIGKGLTQQDLIDYLEDWAMDGIVTCFQGAEEQSASAAIASIRRIKFDATSNTTHVKEDYRAEKSRFDSIEASSAAGSIPTHFVLTAPMYVGLTDRDIHVRLMLNSIKQGDMPTLRMRILRRELIEEAIAKEVETELRHAWTDVAVFIGTTSR